MAGAVGCCSGHSDTVCKVLTGVKGCRTNIYVTLTRISAAEFVTDCRRRIVGEIETRLGDLEGKVATNLSGPIEIPRAGSPMSDAWAAIRGAVPYPQSFTIRGERLFCKSRRGQAGAFGPSVGVLVDTLDAYLDRCDPGSANTNDALEAFIADLVAIRELRGQRGAIMRDGIDDPSSLAGDVFELVALTGPYDQAVTELLELERDMEGEMAYDIDAEFWGWAETVPEQPVTEVSTSSTNVDVDPVGIKEIADRLGVKRRTVDQWLQRDLRFPEPRWKVGGRPAWEWEDVEHWVLNTDRLKDKPPTGHVNRGGVRF